MRIAEPYYLLLLLLVPLTVWIYWGFIRWRKKSWRRLGNSALIQQLFPVPQAWKITVKYTLMALALCFFILSIANPETLSPGGNQKKEGLDVAVVIDLSESMLAPDIQPSRLEVAKEFVRQFISRSVDYKSSLVGFAGSAVTLVPLTPDRAPAAMILESLGTASIPVQGSDIGAAIEEAIRSLPGNQNHQRAIVLISDGEDHEGKARDAIEKAIEEGIVIYTFGIGTAGGDHIPDDHSSLKRDEEGEIVVTKLNARLLSELASKTGGMYYERTGRRTVDELLSNLENIDKNEYSQKILAGYESQFQYVLFAALVLLIIETLLTGWKKK